MGVTRSFKRVYPGARDESRNRSSIILDICLVFWTYVHYNSATFRARPMRPVSQRSSTFHRPLDTLLGAVANVRVLRVLADHGGALTPTTLANRARVTRQSAWNAIARLDGLGVLERVGQGRGTSYRLNPAHPFVPPLQALFRTESQRVERLFDAVRTAAGGMKPPPVAVWLFGSVARGEDRPGSDIDVAILSPEGQSSYQQYGMIEALGTFMGELTSHISVIAMTKDDIRRMRRKRDRFWTELKRDGVPLFGPAPAEAVRD